MRGWWVNMPDWWVSKLQEGSGTYTHHVSNHDTSGTQRDRPLQPEAALHVERTCKHLTACAASQEDAFSS